EGTQERVSTVLARDLRQECEAFGIEGLKRPLLHPSVPQESKLLEVAQDGPGGVCDRRAPQPAQRREAAGRVGLQKGIKALLAVCGQERGEVSIGFGLGSGPRLSR